MQMGEDTKQIERMIQNALGVAGLEISDIDYVNSHGTGTINNDDIEAKVLYKLFGRTALVNSTKSLVGHSIGASGGLEAIVTALSLQHQTTHVCKNLSSPNSHLNFVKSVETFPIKNAISQSFAFGGHNSALIFSKFSAEENGLN
jgi:3-oxoacyl-[acyl-carrier-protein] synthase II